jgi:ketosteroid isomerase-like protein
MKAPALFLLLLTTAPAFAQSAQSPCIAPAYRAFDFWLGEWEAFDAADNALAAHVRVTSVENGCALREEYHGTDGSSGESLSSWDESHQVWRQNWVSGRGSQVSIEGTLHNGSLILTGSEQGTHTPDLVRGTWTPEATGVREVGERSTDNGQTWQPWFDLHFRPATADDPNAESDRKTLAALDDQFQLAVKNNDTAAIGRLLAPNFILVNGKGQVFTRAQLVAEAQAGTVYEHQEDSNKTVRLYGDTAVVTALLWVKGTDAGKPFDKKVWFSDTYLRTPNGWQYTFAQSSLAAPTTTP